MKLNTEKPYTAKHVVRSGAMFLSLATISMAQPVLAQSAGSQAKMSQMLDEIEKGKIHSYAGGSGRPSNMGGYANTMGGNRPSNMGGYANSMGGARPSNMGGYANMMGARRPSNMGGYANAMGNRGNSSQMIQLMKEKITRMQSGGAPGPIMQMMRQGAAGGAPNMVPGMRPGASPSIGMQSGLFQKMMQQESAMNNMKRQPVPRGVGMPARVAAPLPAKPAAPATSSKMSDLEKQMEQQYGK